MTGPLFAPRVRSLRRRLLLSVSIGTLVLWAAAAALSYGQAQHEVQELMDAQMAQSAALLLTLATKAPASLDGVAANMASLRGASDGNNELTLEFQVGRSDGSVVVRSPLAPMVSPAGTLGFADFNDGKEQWRGLMLATGDGSYRIQVAQSIRLRDQEALEIAAKTVLPLGLFIPLLLALIYYAVRRALKPLDDLATEVSARSSENLHPLTSTQVPREAQPLVDALNRLLLRLGTTLDNERRFTADAAHELRTPLAAVRVQAQVALASHGEAEHQHALRQVIAGTDRATRLVEQLLRLARLDPLARLPNQETLDLARLARTAVDEACATSPEGSRHLGLAIDADPLPVVGSQDLLAIALRNLIDNARRYTPPESVITVFVRLESGLPVMGVMDDGPGVPNEELPKLIERFYRGRETSAEGSGLGLAIVHRIAQLHDARLEISKLEGGGFMAQLRWSSAATARNG
ncbi:MAG: sensor histidine kinase N-terminal domain-containing protein [Zoogloeaceae bacterium]|nr:sensor histidine kinase N-terminal domain-containing protein [Zoogloeaceae bacterium]